jgi:crotonobetainyl-CoA:carnitine CoA-transferase CaiB-like acyl-CoA transferase
VQVFPYTGAHYETLFAAAGRDDLAGDERLSTPRGRQANSDLLYTTLASIISAQPTEWWLTFCREHGIPATKVTDLDELVERLPVVEHRVAGEHRQVPPPVRFSRTPASVRREAPLVGEHNREVLREVGFSDEEVDGLEASGVLRARR